MTSDTSTPKAGSRLSQLRAYIGRFWPTLVVVALFDLLAFAYFTPAVIEGRELFQQDVAGASGTAQDVRDHYADTGETSYWTNSLFGGMPMYQIAPSYPSLSIIKKVQDVLSLQWPLNLLPSYSWLLFVMLWGFYLFMRSLKQERLVSVLGALMWCFSSYFIILIDAGHIWKLMVLAFVPPTIAGIIYSYEGQYLRGGVLTAFFASLQLMSNHVQMSYYFAFAIFFIVLAYLYAAIKEKRYKHFAIASGVTLAAALVSIAINISNIYHTYEYTQETMRGGSALASPSSGGAKPSGGLDKDYITAWSYGKAETLTFLVPNLYGGASGYLAQNDKAMDKLENSEMKQIVGGMNHYWGDQPFTSGPVYVGAFVLFLAILALFVVRTPLKWALLGVTILSLALGWGHNLMWVSDLFIDYFPLYNKFRTVSSILVLAEFTIPTLAILALVEFLRSPQRLVQEERIGIYTSLALTLGIAFFLALVPGMFFDFMSQQEVELFRQHLADPRIVSVMSALKEVRASIVSADAWRSVAVILLSLALCWAYYRKLYSARVAVILLSVVTLADLWLVDKRYLNDGKFIDTSNVQKRATPVTELDLEIRKDTDPHYRVLNLSVSPFNDATTSYSHRSIGGYHAAKLGRYQDLIEHQISKQNQQVLNMLDMRYLILPGDNQRPYVQRNDEAMGAAWLIAPEKVQIAQTAEQEMSALNTLDLRHEAVLAQSASLPKTLHNSSPTDSLSHTAVAGSIKLLDYKPNRAKYAVDSPEESLAVFSEVYYPHGWTLSIDGKPAPIERANYLLRAVFVPKGKHIIEMSFDPESIHTTERISVVAQILLLLSILALFVRKIKNIIYPTSYEA